MKSVKTLEEVRKIKEEFEGEILDLNEVTGVDLRYESSINGKLVKPVIIVYVSNKKELLDKDLLPEEFQGIPVDVEERRFVLHSNKQ